MLKKIVAFSISLVGAVIGMQIILLPIVIILNTSLISNSSKILGALIFVIGLGLSIVSGVYIFKKMWDYSNKILQNI